MPQFHHFPKRGPLRYHPQIDLSCQSIVREDLPYECSHFTAILLDDMRSRPFAYLDKHYPELVFDFKPGRRVPVPRPDFKVEFGRGWRTANWRTA